VAKMLKKLMNRAKKLDEQTLQIYLGRRKMIISNRYQVIYYLNNILQGLLYVIGSLLFLFEFNKTVAISFFLAGSILMVSRSFIQIIRDIHLKKLDDETGD
jgi:ABC-type multidrug transport system fused ATPase/permease subunit